MFGRISSIVVTALLAAAGVAILLAAYWRSQAVHAATASGTTSLGPPPGALALVGLGLLAVAAAVPGLLRRRRGGDVRSSGSRRPFAR